MDFAAGHRFASRVKKAVQSQSTSVKKAVAKPDAVDLPAGGTTSSGPKSRRSTKAGVDATGMTAKQKRAMKTKAAAKAAACGGASQQKSTASSVEGTPPEKQTAIVSDVKTEEATGMTAPQKRQ